VGVLTFILVFSVMSNAATETGQLQVSATVVAACTVSTTAVNFGNVTGVNTEYSTGDVTVNCANGLPYHIALDAGLNYASPYRKLAGSGYFADYRLGKVGTADQWGDSDYANTYPGGASLADTGDGTNQAHPVRAWLDPFSGIPAETVLTDTVTVTVHY